MPCADKPGGIETTHNQELSGAPQQNHNEVDDCSPFCHCACCAGFSLNHTIASVTTLDAFVESPMFGHLPSQAIEVALPVWQPPQIA